MGAASRMSDTRVRRAPAVAMCGRLVVVAVDSAERPVQARTARGAERNTKRGRICRAMVGVVPVTSMPISSTKGPKRQSRHRCANIARAMAGGDQGASGRDSLCQKLSRAPEYATELGGPLGANGGGGASGVARLT